MDEFKRSVMVALLPITTDWCKIALPHMTLVYAGQIEDLRPTDFNELAKIAASVAMEYHPIQLDVNGIAVFGQEPEKVEVLKLQATPDLLRMQRRFASWSASEFPFNPHCTIGPAGSFTGNLPPALAFDRILVQWGEESIQFWLRPLGEIA